MIMKESSRKKILIINPFGIGDVLFATPLVRNIKYNFPESTIAFICNQRTVDLLNNSPYIDKIFVFEKDYFRQLKEISFIKCLKELWRFFYSIKIMRFDFAIDLSLGGRTSFYLWLAGIKNRLGFNYKNRSWFLNKKIDIQGYEKKHIVQYYLELLTFLELKVKDDFLDLFLNNEDKAFADEFLKQNGIACDDLIFAIVPGGGASWGRQAVFKHWPTEKFAELADKCVEKYKAKIIICGDLKDEAICKDVSCAMKHNFVMACSRTTLRQFAALLGKCNLVITNDGGPLHVAVAVGAKTLSIFGPVDEAVYGPYPLSKKHRTIKAGLDCQPCYQRFRMGECDNIECLNNLKVETVFEKVGELI